LSCIHVFAVRIYLEVDISNTGMVLPVIGYCHITGKQQIEGENEIKYE
jgi:hypothetical protein